MPRPKPGPNASPEERYEYLRAQRPHDIKRYVQEKKMTDPDPDVRVPLHEAVKIQADCEDMCPEIERVRRIVENDIGLPEFDPSTLGGDRRDRVPDEKRMVKAYKRSAAGDEKPLPSDLRTPRALSVCTSWPCDPAVY